MTSPRRVQTERRPIRHDLIPRSSSVTFDWRGQAAANATWSAGTHSVKTGTELNYVSVDETVGLNQTGGSWFRARMPPTILDTLSVGGLRLNRFDSPTVTYLRQIGNLQQSMATSEVAAFVQDSWRVGRTSPSPTVCAGKVNGIRSPEANNSSLVNRLAGFTFPSGRQVDPTIYPRRAGAGGARVRASRGIPRGHAKTVVRGNAGIYYARSPGIIFAGPLSNFRLPPADLSVQLPFPVPADNLNKTIYQQLALIGLDLNRTPLGSLPIVTPEQIGQVVEALGLTFDPYFGAQPVRRGPAFRESQGLPVGIRRRTVGRCRTHGGR